MQTYTGSEMWWRKSGLNFHSSDADACNSKLKGRDKNPPWTTCILIFRINSWSNADVRDLFCNGNLGLLHWQIGLCFRFGYKFPTLPTMLHYYMLIVPAQVVFSLHFTAYLKREWCSSASVCPALSSHHRCASTVKIIPQFLKKQPLFVAYSKVKCIFWHIPAC